MNTAVYFCYAARLVEVITFLLMDERWDFDLEAMHLIRNLRITICEIRYS